MIETLLNNIKNNEDIKKSLIDIRAYIKELRKNGIDAASIINQELQNDLTLFGNFLTDEDAKVRKNSALILGDINGSDYLQNIFNAYMKESQLYNKSSYLKALFNMDYRSLLPDLKKRQADIMNEELNQDNKKHLSEELHFLSDMIHAMDGFDKHVFTGYDEILEVALLTNRNHIHVTVDELEKISKTVQKKFNAGVMIKTQNLREVMKLRTFKEILFCIEGMRSLPSDPIMVADKITASTLLDFLCRMHSEEAPFYFRIELKCKLDSEKKSRFNKKLAAEIEKLTNRQLVNSTSNFEIEIRLIENKEGNYNSLVKLYTLTDDRFNYRKNTISSAIHPVNAALTMNLSKKYLKKEAQVLDPFCGTGTMLIERDIILKAGDMYGIDIYGDAIKYARENAEAAGCQASYINRNFFEFKHNQLFDEIITDMPFIPSKRVNDMLTLLYADFFAKAFEHLKDDGIMIIYTHNYDLCRDNIKKASFKIEREYEISMMEGTYVFILKKKAANI